MAEYFLTLAEIAAKLKVPESTIRSWRDKYIDFIPYVASGRKRRYPENALKVFKRIRELSAEGVNAINIAERLSIDFSRHIENSSTNSIKTAHNIMTPLPAIERVALAIESLADQKQETQQLRERVEELENKLQGYEELENRLRAIEKNSKQQRKPFWSRSKRRQDPDNIE